MAQNSDLQALDDIIESKLLDMNTAFLAKIISVDGELKTAKIQPLTRTKQYGKAAQNPSPLSKVPILANAKYKLEFKPKSTDKFTITKEKCSHCNEEHLTSEDAPSDLEIKYTKIKSGDVVLCVCCDRDISQTKSGNMATPALGHHNQADSIIVGIL